MRVLSPGRAPVEQHTHVGDGERALVEVTLPPSSHRLRLETVPSGAYVYVNGVLQTGQTPYELTVDDNEFYQLAVKKDSFEMTQRAVAPDACSPDCVGHEMGQHEQGRNAPRRGLQRLLHERATAGAEVLRAWRCSTSRV